MSVTVVGMSLPDCCMDCPICNHEFGCCNLIPNSSYYNEDEQSYNPFEERHKDCPLKEDNE